MMNYEEIIKIIYKMNNGIIDEPETVEELFVVDELRSTFIPTTFKILDLIKHDYRDYHFSINDRAYDVFVYNNEKTNTDNLNQIIMCNNYVQIFNFRQDDYDHRRLISEFSVFDKVYAFYDFTVIIIEHRKDDKEYINIDLD